MPDLEVVMESHLGEGVEEDCTVGYQGGTWWLGRWMMKDNTENNSSTLNPSTNGVGRGKNKLEQSHNQLISKCITQTTSNKFNWNNICPAVQGCQCVTDVSRVTSVSICPNIIQHTQETQFNTSMCVDTGAAPQPLTANTEPKVCKLPTLTEGYSGYVGSTRKRKIGRGPWTDLLVVGKEGTTRRIITARRRCGSAVGRDEETEHLATIQPDSKDKNIHIHTISPVVKGMSNQDGGRGDVPPSSSQSSPRARASPSTASPSRRGGGISRKPAKPADWYIVKKRNIKPDGLVQTRLKQFVRQFPKLGILVSKTKTYEHL